MRYEARSYADNLFYESPDRWAAREDFPAVGAPLPTGWHGATRDVWAARTPDGVELPDQGWKIHVSARTGNAEHVLAVVSGYCLFHRVAFEFLRSPALLHGQDTTSGSHGSGGTLMTLYPADEPALEHCLDSLDALLDGQPGPDIPGSLRWRTGPLHLRYGGFTERYCRSETGEPVLALREPSGALRPDVRRAAFDLPDWAPVPAVLAGALAGRDTAGGAGFPYAARA